MRIAVIVLTALLRSISRKEGCPCIPEKMATGTLVMASGVRRSALVSRVSSMAKPSVFHQRSRTRSADRPSVLTGP